CLICLGCQSITGVERSGDDGAGILPHESPNEHAVQLWQQGQHAMKVGAPEQAIALYQESLDADRRLEKNHLSLAAAFIEKGDDAAACEHLGLYLQAHP